MFNPSFDLKSLNSLGTPNMVSHLGIEFIEIGKDFLKARMPVNEKTRQPFGILHGGASVVLAETIGSLASYMCLNDPEKQMAVGLEVNANHIKAVKDGWVYGECTNIHLGRKTHIWSVKITDENQKLVCLSRLTVIIVEK